jgi:hypothetical protein
MKVSNSGRDEASSVFQSRFRTNTAVRAIARRGGVLFCLFCAAPQATAAEKEVSPAREGGKVEISQGLRPGEQIIRLGQYELEDGAKVLPAEASSVKPSAAEPERG